MPTADRRELRRRLVAIAGVQAGYFTAAQARTAGYSYAAQRYHAQHNNWVRVDRGIFRLPEWPAGDHEDLVRWTLWSRDRAIVSHDTAASVHDLGDLNPAKVHLTVPPGFRASAPGLVLHRGILPESDVETRSGYRITTPLRSVFDIAASGIEAERLAGLLRDLLDRGIATARILRERAEAFGAEAALRIERALGNLQP